MTRKRQRWEPTELMIGSINRRGVATILGMTEERLDRCIAGYKKLPKKEWARINKVLSGARMIDAYARFESGSLAPWICRRTDDIAQELRHVMAITLGQKCPQKACIDCQRDRQRSGNP